MRRLLLVATAVLLLVLPGAPEGTRVSAGLLEPVQVAGWELTVRGVTRLTEPLPVTAEGEALRPDGRLLMLLVDLENRADIDRAPMVGDFALTGDDGRTVANVADRPEARIFAVQSGRAPFGDTIAPGEQVETILLFDVAPDAGLFHLAFAGAGIVRIDECHCNLPSPVRTVTPWKPASTEP